VDRDKIQKTLKPKPKPKPKPTYKEENLIPFHYISQHAS